MPYPETEFMQAVEQQDMKLVKSLLSNPDLKAKYKARALQIASANGHLGIASLLLENVKPSLKVRDCLIPAIGNGHMNIIEKVLEDPKVNPGQAGNVALAHACQHNQAKAVTRLLKDKRVSLLGGIQNPLALALALGHHSVVDAISAHVEN